MCIAYEVIFYLKKIKPESKYSFKIIFYQVLIYFHFLIFIFVTFFSKGVCMEVFFFSFFIFEQFNLTKQNEKDILNERTRMQLSIENIYSYYKQISLTKIIQISFFVLFFCSFLFKKEKKKVSFTILKFHAIKIDFLFP